VAYGREFRVFAEMRDEAPAQWVERQATSSLASVVMMAKLRIHSLEAGSFQFSHTPPSPKGYPSFRHTDLVAC
jgi:hypothetical protein